MTNRIFGDKLSGRNRRPTIKIVRGTNPPNPVVNTVKLGLQPTHHRLRFSYFKLLVSFD